MVGVGGGMWVERVMESVSECGGVGGWVDERRCVSWTGGGSVV